MTELAIIIVSYNARSHLEACLRSLARHRPRRAHQIVVVDNASTDASAVAVRDGWPEVTLLESGTNEGFARACNRGIRASDAPLLLADPSSAAAGPRLVDADGRVEISFGRMPGPFSELWQKLRGRLHAGGVGPVSRRIERAARRQHYPDWVSGACLLVRRVDAEAVGLLDERYFMYLEDVDFCAAIRRRGRHILFTPAAEILHLRGRSASTAPIETARAYRHSQLAFYAKHHRAWLPVLRTYLWLHGRLPSD